MRRCPRSHLFYLVMMMMMPTLCAASNAQAAQCRGSKIVQSCTTTGGVPNTGMCFFNANDPNGAAAYQMCVASAPLVGGVQTCTPVRVPCDYPESIFDLIPFISGSNH